LVCRRADALTVLVGLVWEMAGLLVDGMLADLVCTGGLARRDEALVGEAYPGVDIVLATQCFYRMNLI
jgi:hypothetical protein